MRWIASCCVMVLAACGPGLPASGATDGSSADGDGDGDDDTPRIKLATQGATTCALQEGEVRCWGNNDVGELGHPGVDVIGDDEHPIDHPPVSVGGRVVDLVAGYKGFCAHLGGSVVRCWGQNPVDVEDHIGDDELPSERMLDFDFGEDIVQVTKGSALCVLTVSGGVRCVGRGVDGQHGYGVAEMVGDDESVIDLGDIPLGGKAVQITAGVRATCAILEGGAVRCWGEHRSLGIMAEENVGDDETPDSAPTVQTGGAVELVHSGGRPVVCVSLVNGDARCWGTGGEYGYLGVPPPDDEQWWDIGDDEHPSDFPPIDLDGRVVAFDTSRQRTCALLDTDEFKCWGGQDPEMGYPNYLDDYEWHRIFEPGPPIQVGGSVEQFTMGPRHTCVVLAEGIRCWGYGDGLGLGPDYVDAWIGDDEHPATAPIVQVF